MSSSYIIEPQESGSEKKDDTLIIVVNDDGTISVDQETLQNLIMNQSNANVSVVRLGQGDADAGNGEITLTVDPPAFTQQSVTPMGGGTTTVTDTSSLVDPFMEMDPEQLERLETALQSEEAKQILGENVTAMLDMLSVEEQQNSIRYSVELDHCYTSRLSPSDPKPRDPLPIAHSPGSSDVQYSQGSSPPRTMSTISSPVSDVDSTTPKPKPIAKTTKPVGRPRKNALPATSPNLSGSTRPLVNTVGGPKAPGQHHPVQRNVTNVLQQQGANKMHARANEDAEEEGTSSSTESSESEPPSDNDSDFGPRGPRRGNVRARGGRKGLTTRGGSMTATRRRGPNKHLDMEQVRRLDMEMAAAVNAMKSPEKDDKSGRFSPIKGKRQVKVLGGRKKDDSQLLFQTTPSATEDSPISVEKPLQTTNQVKAGLISANMIKGDMILTKPGQAKSAQKVQCVQKQVLMKANDIKTLGLKKQVMIPKGKLINQVTTKFFTNKDGKLIQLPTAPNKAAPSSPSVCQTKGTLSQVSVAQQPVQVQTQSLQQQSPKPILPTTVTKLKPEIKKEKRRADNGLTDVLHKEVDPAKSTIAISAPVATAGMPVTPTTTPTTPGPVATVGICPTTPTPSTEAKVLESAKKHPKKEHRKSPGYVVDSLGPALFSTPDIIRRVSGGSEMKISETSTGIPSSTSTTTSVAVATTSGLTSIVTQITSTPNVASTSTTTPSVAQTSATSSATKVTVLSAAGEEAVTSEQQLPGNGESQAAVQANETARKVDGRPPFQTEELQSSLDPGGIEGEEHLLATLEMEASKHEEELLAEALLLQEELGVDLADHPALVDQTPTTAEPLQPTNVLVPPITSSEHQLSKSLDTTTTTPVSTIAREPTKKPKDDKEPIQIVRGGRIITLPPIEAPATRSKRLQAKNESVQKTVEIVKKVEKFSPQAVATQQQQLQLPQTEEMRSGVDEEDEEDEEEDEDEDEEEEDNSDSEDDPDRLWCICKRPHNNRFMICCDVCEDWFHGKCVHVSKAMGQQMEEKGIEWVCPNCLKKKTEEIKNAKYGMPPGKQKPRSESVSENSVVTRQVTPSQVVLSPTREMPSSSILSTSEQTIVQYQGTTQCVVCKKEARNSSIYCSDACILAHAQETLTKDKPAPSVSSNTKIVRSPQTEPAKAPPADARIIVFERKTGRVLTGVDAPTRSNLKQWLKENPTFEVVRPNSLNTLQIGGKTVTAIQTQGLNKTGKSPQLSAAKIQTLPKMIYAKVAGSRQTILAASNKKLLVVTSPQQQGQPNASQIAGRVTPLKQALLPNTTKAPIILKHPSPKTVVQTQAKTQQQVGITVQRQTPIKKQEIPKAPISQAKQQTKLPLSTPKKPETEPIRLNIRKTLTELLSTRIKETDDLKLTDEEINDLAFNIELEMYKYFKDTGAKYKAKYRSLVFNIKDTKNLTLFRKIADRSLTPDAVVRLSPDEMASQELAEWREKETKHQLEMIKKNELDLMAQAKSIVVKTHKGEQIIENDGGIDHVDPKTPVQDIVTALNSADNVTTAGAAGSSSAVLTTATSTSGIQASVSDEFERERRESVREDDKLRTKESKKLKGAEEKRKRDREKDSRLRGKNERSVSRERHRRRHSRDREHSRTREKSRERKSNAASTRGKESRRDKERDREKDKDRERNKDRDRGRNRERGRERGRTRDQKHKGVDESHMRNRSGSRHRETKVAATSDKRSDDEHRRRELDRKGEYGSSQQITPPSAGITSEKEKPIEDRLWRHIEDEATTNTIDGNDSDVSDREPTSTVTIKTPDINEDAEREKEHEEAERETPKSVTPTVGISTATHHTVWRGFVNMVDVAKFFITAQEVSGQAKDLMDDLPDTVDVVGRISHETVWDYISKMKKTGSKEILVIRLTAANDEEKIPYITLYSYLNSRSRLGVVGNVSKNIKDFYIMPFSNQSTIPPVLLPLTGPGFEEHRPHLLLGIIVRNKRKRIAGIPSAAVPSKLSKKDTDRSYTPPLISSIPKDKGSSSSGGLAATTPAAAAAAVVAAAAAAAAAAMTSITTTTTTTLLPSSSPPVRYHKDKQLVTQMTLDSLNKAHIGMSRSAIDTATICKIVPELSSKLDLTSSPGKVPLDDDGDEPYSPGEMDDDMNLQGVSDSGATGALLSSSKNSNELQRKMDELNRQIEEQKQQIQNISSSFLGEATSTLPGLGLDPPSVNDCDEAYSPSDTRSFTPPPPGITKFAQPILDKVSDITIPPNLQEILANVKRQESSKVDPYLPSKPSASFLPTVNSSVYQTTEKYAPTAKSVTSVIPSVTPVKVTTEKSSFDSGIVQQQASPATSKENSNSGSSSNSGGKSTLSSLSDLDLIRKAEEELAAVAAAAASATPQISSATSGSTPLMANTCDPSLAHSPMQTAVAAAAAAVVAGMTPLDRVSVPPPAVDALPTVSGPGASCTPPLMMQLPPTLSSSPDPVSGGGTSGASTYASAITDTFKKTYAPEQPKPPGLEDEDFPAFPSTPPTMDSNSKMLARSKFASKSGVVLSVKRKISEDGSLLPSPTKTPRTKSRWGQGPSE